MLIINLQLRLNNRLGGIIWSESGNHGNQWSIAQVTLQNIQINTPTYQVGQRILKGFSEACLNLHALEKFAEIIFCIIFCKKLFNCNK